MATSYRYVKALRTASTMFLLIVWLTTPSSGRSCDLDTCNSACIGFEVANSFCHNDYQPWDNLVSCLCQEPFHAVSTESYSANLDQCVACNLPNVGPSQLSFYQSWDVICLYYKQAGEQAALNVAQDSVANVVQAFSASRLPALRSAFCGEVVVSTSSTSATSILTTSTVRSTSSSVMISSVISSTASSSSSALTSNAVTSSTSSTSSMVSASGTTTTSNSGSSPSASPTPNSGVRAMPNVPCAKFIGTCNYVLMAASIGIGGLMLTL